MSQTCPKCQRVIDLPGPPILYCCFCGWSMTGLAGTCLVPA